MNLHYLETCKKDVHATGAHILIIPQQGGINRIYLLVR